MFSTDIISLIVAEGLGVEAATLFLSANATLPDGDGPLIRVTPTGGPAPLETHDNKLLRPSAQIVVHAASFTLALTRANAILDVLAAVKNRLIGATWYQRITALQSEPFDLGPDSSGRAQVAFNVVATKRPS